MPAHKPTIKDVAERAGCGIATVSRVLNESGPASIASRERVLEAAEALGFQFNEFGRSLKSQRSRTIGVLIPTLNNPVFADAVQGIQEAAATAGYGVILTSANYDSDVEEQAVATLIAKQVDAVIVTVAKAEDSKALDLLRTAETPHCLIFNQTDSHGHLSVGVDNINAAQLVGQKLIELGHSQCAFLAVQFTKSDRSLDRYAGFAHAFSEADMAKPALIEVDYAPVDLELALARLFEKHPATTAIFASNDMLALGCIRALRSLSLRVPDDVSVVGFDGIGVGDLVNPSLATIVTPGKEMGAKAARMLTKALAGGDPLPGGVIALPFEFRYGESLSNASPKKAGDRAATRSPATSTTLPATRHAK